MNRRNCMQVIGLMMIEIPPNERALLDDLLDNYHSAAFKAPEDTTQWEEVSHTLEKHIPLPSKHWHFEVLAIFTMKSVEQLRKYVKEFSNKSK